MTDENLTFSCQNLSGIDHLTWPGDSVSPECHVFVVGIHLRQPNMVLMAEKWPSDWPSRLWQVKFCLRKLTRTIQRKVNAREISLARVVLYLQIVYLFLVLRTMLLGTLSSVRAILHRDHFCTFPIFVCNKLKQFWNYLQIDYFDTENVWMKHF